MTEINDSNQRLVFGQKVRITGGHLKPGASLADYPRRFSKEQVKQSFSSPYSFSSG